MVDMFYYRSADTLPEKVVDEEFELEGKKDVEDKFED